MDKLQIQTHKQYDQPEVVEDKTLSKLFPHTFLPHYVWIDGNGILREVTGEEEVNKQNITAILEGNTDKIVQKFDKTIAYNKDKPMQIQLVVN